MLANEIDYTAARDLVRKYISPRYAKLDVFEHFVSGTQYDGRPNWWTAIDTPLAERAPCVVYPIVQIAVTSFVDLVLGEHRFPTLSIKGIEPKKLRKILRRSRFESVTRESLAAGLGCGSAAVIAGMRAERPFLDTVPAKWCRPEFGADQRTVTALEIEYPYITEEQDPLDGKWHACAYLFRRVIDAKADTTFKPFRIVDQYARPSWTKDPARSVEHALGYCPVVWWPCMRGATVEGRYDGRPIHEHILDEITAHDLSLSQRQRAAFLSGDPQWTEIGVEGGYNPSPGGRAMRTPATPGGGPVPAGERPNAAYISAALTAARKKGPGNVWQYPDPMTKVELHQLSAGALDAIDKNSRDLRLKLCDALAYVPLDPESLPRLQVSGKALEALKERQLARCDYIRDDVSEGLLLPTLALLARVTGEREAADAEDVTVVWPPYYTANADDRAKELASEVDAILKGANFVDCDSFRRVAKKRMTRLVLDGASDEELETIEEEIDAEPETDADDASGVPPVSPVPPVDGQDGDDAADPPAQPPAAPKPGLAPAAPPVAPMPAEMARAQSGVPQVAPDAHLRGATNAGVSETVYQLLKEDYPADAIDWIRSANVEGPRLVPLDQIDFTNRENWSASHEPIDKYIQKISDGTMKPIVLVNEPNDSKFMIIDGHHRALAYDHLGQPAMAYIVHTGSVSGPWDAMHSSQNSLKGELTSQQKET